MLIMASHSMTTRTIPHGYGQIAPGAKLSSEPMIGNDPRAHPVETQVKKEGTMVVRPRSLNHSALRHHRKIALLSSGVVFADIFSLSFVAENDTTRSS